MAQLPAIYTIQASDAPQHTGKLQEILQNLKTENRIGSFTSVKPDEDLSSVTDIIQEEDLILVVLTNQLDSQREQIETELKALQAARSGVRIGEIIVDNVPYENEFITFPADLRNIRDREDKDTVWSNIDQSLKDMFPAEKKPEPVPPMDWPKYLKISGIIIGVILGFFLLRSLFVDDNGATEERVAVEVEEAQPAEVEEARPTAVEMTTGRFVVRQTWFGDFDRGREVPQDAPRNEADFWFEARTATDRVYSVENNSKLNIMRGVSDPTFSQVQRTLETGDISEVSVDRLTPGTWFAVRTTEGNYAAFTVQERIGTSPGEMQIHYRIWRE